MTVRDSGVSNLGAIGIEGQRMTRNDFMLSVMETPTSQTSVPTWFETERPTFIDHVDDYDEGVFSAVSQWLFFCLTHVISTACNFAEAHKSWTVTLVIIDLAAYLGGQVQA